MAPYIGNRDIPMTGQAVRWGSAAIWLISHLGPALGGPARPVADVPSLDVLPIVVAKPYDPAANADAAVNEAFARARLNGKRVLLELGGNWCPDCVILTNVMKLPSVAPFIAAHYEVVLVDIGRLNRNLQVPERFGFKHRLEGVPFVIVADGDGKLLNGTTTATLVTARTMNPQAIVDRLADWAE